jgi:transposase
MDTALDSKQTDSRHALAARADKELAHAYEQIARADEQIAHAEQQLSKLEREAVPGKRRLFDRPAVRGLTGLLLAGCIGVAAIAWQSSYRDAAKEVIARLGPQRVVASSSPLENPAPPAQPSPPVVEAPAAETAPPQPELLAQAAPEDGAPAGAALSPELTQLLQSMARDVATLGQRIEQLKAGQEQMARDNANTAAQLKASQEQMARVLAKTSEQSLRPRILTPPTRPVATPPPPPPRRLAPTP